MLKYRTMVYEGEKNHAKFGGDFGKVILLQSEGHELPSDAMECFNKFHLPDLYSAVPPLENKLGAPDIKLIPATFFFIKISVNLTIILV